MDSRNLGLRTVCMTWREGGSLAWAAFHEYPLPASMVRRYVPALSWSPSSPLAWDSRMEELRALTVSVLAVSRWEWRWDECECECECEWEDEWDCSSLAVSGARGAKVGESD